MLYSGPPNEEDDHHNGVGLLLSKKAKASLMEWEPVSDRIIVARFMSKIQKLTIIQCYAPTNVAEQEDKEDFYNQLQGIIDSVTSRDI